MSDDFEGRFSTDDGAAFPLAELKLVEPLQFLWPCPDSSVENS